MEQMLQIRRPTTCGTIARHGALRMTATSAPLTGESAPTVRPDGRAALAAFLSFLFPGAGQAYNGQTRLAWLLATPALLLVAGVAVAVVGAHTRLLTRLLDIRFLIGLIVLDLSFLGWRLVAIIQAHGSRDRFTPRSWPTWVTGLLLFATVGMHALPAYYAALGIDTVSTVTLGGSGGDIQFGAVPGVTYMPQPSEQPEVEHGERVNILLVGIDAAPGRVTALTDTMLVVSLDPNGRASGMISVPRDLYGVPLPDGTPYNAKLNTLMVIANQRPTQYPLGGVGTLKATIGNLLGIKIHYFAAINLLGFKKVIDVIGGVDVKVERAINDPTYVDASNNRVGFYISAGEHHLNGTTALAYARSRKSVGDSDFTRAARQQQLLAAVRDKLTSENLLLLLPSLLNAVKSTIATDIPSDRIAALAQAVQDADMSQLQQVVLQPPDYMSVDAHSAAGYILIPDLAAIRSAVDRIINPPPPTPPPTPPRGL